MTINLSVTTLFLAVFVSLSLWYTVASIGAQLVLWSTVAVPGPPERRGRGAGSSGK